jgi:hypothetical protein
MERFNLKTLNEVEGTGQYRVDISNRFAALENLDTEVDINRVWEAIRENITTFSQREFRFYKLKKYQPWLDERCSELLHKRKQIKLQWLQDPCEINWE